MENCKLVKNQEITRAMYDGIIFYPTNNHMYFEHFQFKGKRDVPAEDERILCYVSLFSIKDDQLDRTESFRAHFSDPLEYAHGLRKNTGMFGIIIHDNKKAKSFIRAFEREGEEILANLINQRIAEEHRALPMWTRLKLWWNNKPYYGDADE